MHNEIELVSPDSVNELTKEQQTKLKNIGTLKDAVAIVKDAEIGMRQEWAIFAAALQAIKDKELWRDSDKNYESFLDFTSGELGYSQSWVYKMLRFPQVAKIVDVTNPTSASALGALEEDDQIKSAWGIAKKLSNGSSPSIADVRKAVTAVKGGYALTEDKDELYGERLRRDITNTEFDDDVALESIDKRLVQAQRLFDALLEKLRSLYRDIESLSMSPEGIWIDMGPVRADFRNVANMLKYSRPFCECISCDGDGCVKCLDSGILIKERFNAYNEAAQLGKEQPDEKEKEKPERQGHSREISSDDGDAVVHTVEEVDE